MFKESIYNIHEIVGGAHYVYNVRREALVRLKQNFKEPVSKSDVLVRQGFFVPDASDEVEELMTARNNAAESEEYQYVRIMTTSCCNARCAYCYERDLPSISMSHDVALDVARFICKSNPRVRVLELCWFGGEPLLNVGVIDDIIDCLKRKHLSNDIVIRSSFITNGFLIDDRIVDAMVSRWNVKEVQVSLDGIGQDYVSAKRYLDKNISFESVIGNVERLVARNVSTKLRLNVDKMNMDKIKSLVAFLGDRFSNCKSLHVYPGYLFDGEDLSNPDLIGIDDSETRKEVAKFFLDHGFRIPLIPHRRNVVCYAGRRHSYFIDPNGNLYKCAQHYADKTSQPIGTIYDSSCEQEKWLSCRLHPKCEKCLALPVCQGGCKAAELTSRKLEQCQATKADIKNHVRALIKSANKGIMVS